MEKKEKVKNKSLHETTLRKIIITVTKTFFLDVMNYQNNFLGTVLKFWRTPWNKNCYRIRCPSKFLNCSKQNLKLTLIWSETNIYWKPKKKLFFHEFVYWNWKSRWLWMNNEKKSVQVKNKNKIQNNMYGKISGTRLAWASIGDLVHHKRM